jgi:hypothetical protein
VKLYQNPKTPKPQNPLAFHIVKENIQLLIIIIVLMSKKNYKYDRARFADPGYKVLALSLT